MKTLKILFLLFLLTIGIYSVKAERIFDTTVKIYDYAQVLTEKEEKKLKTDINKYIEKNNVDMVIVLVKHYNQNTIEEYMDLFYSTNKFGIGDNKSGIMFALDLKNNEVGLKTFGFVNDLYTSNEIKEILNKVNKESSYRQRIDTFIKYSDKYINQFNNIEFEDNIFIVIDWIGIFIVSVMLSTLIVFIGLLKSRNRYIIKKEDTCVKNLIITMKEDTFVTTNTKKRKN